MSEVIRQPGFPTAMLPVVTVTTNLVHFVLALPILIAMILLVGKGFHWWRCSCPW